MAIPELTARGYPEDKIIGTLAGAGTLGLLIPPSIIMIVYGVTAAVQGMTGKQITWFSRVTLPMFWLMVGAVLLVYFVPALVTWLPKQMMG
jgi:TRAP-type C4-dicarboxylate transport system permease large subunit